MKHIDMGPYQPYRKMGESCELREIVDKKVVWPLIDQIDPNNPNFKLRVVTRNDLEEVAELWRASYPEVYGSVHEWILDPKEYEKRVAIAEHWEDHAVTRRHAMMVGEDLRTGKIVMSSIYTRWNRNLHVEASFMAIHPDARKGKIASSIWSNLASFYEWLKESGAEYVTVFCETWQDITQYIWFKRLGWKIAGIFPGNYTRWAGDNNEYRGCTIHFYRLINNGNKFTSHPEEWNMIPEVKELWNCMERINAQSAEEGYKNIRSMVLR